MMIILVICNVPMQTRQKINETSKTSMSIVKVYFTSRLPSLIMMSNCYVPIPHPPFCCTVPVPSHVLYLALVNNTATYGNGFKLL